MSIFSRRLFYFASCGAASPRCVLLFFHAGAGCMKKKEQIFWLNRFTGSGSAAEFSQCCNVPAQPHLSPACRPSRRVPCFSSLPDGLEYLPCMLKLYLRSVLFCPSLNFSVSVPLLLCSPLLPAVTFSRQRQICSACNGFSVPGCSPPRSPSAFSLPADTEITETKKACRT